MQGRLKAEVFGTSNPDLRTALDESLVGEVCAIPIDWFLFSYFTCRTEILIRFNLLVALIIRAYPLLPPRHVPVEPEGNLSCLDHKV